MVRSQDRKQPELYYTREEALKRYLSETKDLGRRLRAESAVKLVINKIAQKRDFNGQSKYIRLEVPKEEPKAPEASIDLSPDVCGNDTVSSGFMGIPDLEIDGLITLSDANLVCSARPDGFVASPCAEQTKNILSSSIASAPSQTLSEPRRKRIAKLTCDSSDSDGGDDNEMDESGTETETETEIDLDEDLDEPSDTTVIAVEESPIVEIKEGWHAESQVELENKPGAMFNAAGLSRVKERKYQWQ
ncbi:hypothetical protein NEHOM01_2026 [Nematocida homosporus]|uniref:uncharacterized protein n=1 Tax=Nematocida homosporus TaxID=1912981 RepID=UPI00221FA2AD|nr:uncharacterized protein NEHOM01_2026 [Nematocida homosporus]KAI5187230.1 hypothetical protein NEHOM01_2026 [Nematocida homosporus]